MRTLLGSLLLLLWSFPLQAQWFQVRSSQADSALRLFSYQVEDQGQSAVSDSTGAELQGAHIGLESRYRLLNLYLLAFFAEDTELSYQEADALASALDVNQRLSLQGSDLPTQLYNEGWSGFLPIPLGESAVFLRGGSRIASDREDVTNEDYHSHVSLLFYPQRKGETRWAFGAFQQSYLGEISEIIPLAQYESRSGPLAWSIGFLHLPGSYDPPVLPYFGLSTNWASALEVELVYPRRVALGVRPFSRMGIRLEWEDSTTRYRLSRKAPWQGNVLAISQQRQQLTLDLQLLTNLELQLGAGTLQQRKWVLSDSALDEELGSFQPSNSDVTQLGASLLVYF